MKPSSWKLMRAAFVAFMLAVTAVVGLTPARAVGGPTVAVLGAPSSASWNTDVQNKLLGTGRFGQVDVINVNTSTPTLATLQQYSAVIVFNDAGFQDSTQLGNNLADFVDGGGRVVVATFATCGQLAGRLATGGYMAFANNGCGQTQGTPRTLVADLPGDPMLAGVNSFSGGSNSWHMLNALAPGATLIAHWSDGVPLLATQQTSGHLVVGLNIYPPSSDARADFWTASTDGATLMANALTVGTSAPPPPPPSRKVTVTADPTRAIEGGNDGAFVFTRTDAGPAIQVNYSISGTATAGSDYDTLPGNVLIPAGASSATVPVHAIKDNTVEGPEPVTVTVLGGNGYVAGTPSDATVNIVEGACTNAQPADFADRDQFDVHAAEIDCIAGYGFAQGFPAPPASSFAAQASSNYYGPTLPVSRAQMASFVARLMSAAGVTLPTDAPDAYPGDNGDVHETAINQIAALGVLDATTGQTGDKYNVSDDMRRDDMAQILVNAYKVVTGTDLPAGPNAFTDDEGNDNEAAINALAAADVVQGTGQGLYDPAGSVSRGQFAGFFARYIQILVDNGNLQPL